MDDVPPDGRGRRRHAAGDGAPTAAGAGLRNAGAEAAGGAALRGHDACRGGGRDGGWWCRVGKGGLARESLNLKHAPLSSAFPIRLKPDHDRTQPQVAQRGGDITAAVAAAPASSAPRFAVLPDQARHLAAAYGDRAFDVLELVKWSGGALAAQLAAGLPYIEAEVVYCCRQVGGGGCVCGRMLAGLNCVGAGLY